MYIKNFLPLCFDWYLQKSGVLVWFASFRERCIAYRHHKSIPRDYFELIKCFVSLFAVTFKLSCHVGWLFQVMCLQSVQMKLLSMIDCDLITNHRITTLLLQCTEGIYLEPG